jgi:hypothetical protein
MGKAIRDRFAKLKISRQYRYQLRRHAAGLCQRCGTEPNFGAHYCLGCTIKIRDQVNKRDGHKKKINCASRRAEAALKK